MFSVFGFWEYKNTLSYNLPDMLLTSSLTACLLVNCGRK